MLSQPYFPSSKPRSADVVLYLDLDGVVQHESVFWHPRRGIYMNPSLPPGRVLFEWLHYLEDALKPFPDVALVLSSSWCVRPGYSKTLQRFPAALRARFIGGTYHRRHHGQDWLVKSAFLGTPRCEQILADVRRRKPRQWLALDDDVDDWPRSALANLVACDGSTGLSDPLVRQLLRDRLEQCHIALHRPENTDR